MIYVLPKSAAPYREAPARRSTTACCGCRHFFAKARKAQPLGRKEDLRDGFALTGLFLMRHVLEPRGQGHSDARDGFINAVTRPGAEAAVS